MAAHGFRSAALLVSAALVAASASPAVASQGTDLEDGSTSAVTVPDDLWEPPLRPASRTHMVLEDARTGEVEVITPGNGIIDFRLEQPYRWNLNGWGDERVSALFHTPGRTPLTEGFYDVGGSITDHDAGYLSWSVGSSGCGQGGWVAVDELEVDAHGLVLVSLRLGSTCHDRPDDDRPWFAAIRWERGTDVTDPDPVGAPPADYPRTAPEDRPGGDRYIYLDSHPDDYVGRGHTYVFTPADRIEFDWQFDDTMLRVWLDGRPAGTFAGPTSVPLRIGFHDRLNMGYNDARGTVRWSMDGRGCAYGVGGSFSLDHLVRAPDGAVEELVLRFLRPCGSSPPMYGEVVWNADIDAVLAAQPEPTDPPPGDPSPGDPSPGDPPPGSSDDPPRTGTPPPTFPDVVDGPHRPAIELLAELGVIEGRADGRFEPGRSVTRAQVASFLVRALGSTPPSDHTGRFPDVEGGPHAANIAALVDAGIVTGFADGTFRPGTAVTRGQMASMLARAFDLPDGDVATPFPDALGSPHAGAIGAVAAAGITEGRADGTFGTGLPTRRDQMASFLARALAYG